MKKELIAIIIFQLASVLMVYGQNSRFDAEFEKLLNGLPTQKKLSALGEEIFNYFCDLYHICVS